MTTRPRFGVRWVATIGGILLTAGLATLIAFYQSARTTGVPHPVDLRGNAHPTVVLREQGFEPRDIIITQGQSVTFTTTRTTRFWPASDPHPEHTIYPEFDPQGPIAPGESWTFRLNRVGTWNFHDHIRSYFTGTIYVDPKN